MKRPWLIQRCEIYNGKLGYDYMGSTEFEIGDQGKSLKRIFAKGLALETSTVEIEGKKAIVYVVASEGFQFAEYQPYLQQLAEHKLRLQEWISFDDAVRLQVGLKASFGRTEIRTNAWFDFENDVLWTLTEENQKALVSALESIKKKWSEKK